MRIPKGVINTHLAINLRHTSHKINVAKFSFRKDEKESQITCLQTSGESQEPTNSNLRGSVHYFEYTTFFQF